MKHYHLRPIVGVLCLFLALSATALVAQQTSKAVSLRVLLPETEAKLLIDGVEDEGIGLDRKVRAVPKKGAKHLEVKATWEPNGYTEIRRIRKIPIQLGQEIVVDLRKPDPKEPDKIEVIYVPTSQEIVDAMCKLAKVGPKDVVYDLGCGDGRIVITAVSKFKAKRGVGVDINPKLVAQSKENAKKAGVADKVEFRHGDVLEIKDLADATVVMLYMGEDINLRLKPILQRTLKPGARVVSHSFTMGEWKPDHTENVRTSEGGGAEIHLWNIDAATKGLSEGDQEGIKGAIENLEKRGTNVEISGGKISLKGGRIGEDGLEGLRAFPGLKDLELANMQITDQALADVGSLKQLQRLRISNTRLTEAGVQHLGRLSELQELSLPFTTISDAGLKHLGGLTKLRELDLSATPVSDAGLVHLKNLTGLRELNLDSTKTTDAGLQHLKSLANLQTLSLCHTPISDAGLTQLRSLTNLKLLNLRGTRTTLGAVQDLRKKMAQAKILHAPDLGLGRFD